MLCCMRTTIRLDDHVLRQAKLAAAQQGCTLTRYIEDALRQRLVATSSAAQEKATYQVPTFNSSTRPGVDLDSNADLLDLMESG